MIDKKDKEATILMYVFVFCVVAVIARIIILFTFKI